MTNEERVQGEPSEWFLRLALLAQSLSKRPMLVYMVFTLLGAALLPGVEPTWLPLVSGFMVGWWVVWGSRRIVRRAQAYLALEEAPPRGPSTKRN